MDEEELSVIHRMVENYSYFVLVSIFLAISIYLINLTPTIENESVRFYVNFGVASGLFLSFYILFEALLLIFKPVLSAYLKKEITNPETRFGIMVELIFVGLLLLFLILGILAYTLYKYPEVLVYPVWLSLVFGFFVSLKFVFPMLEKTSFLKALAISFALILAASILTALILFYFRQLILFYTTISGFVWGIILYLGGRTLFTIYNKIKTD